MDLRAELVDLLRENARYSTDDLARLTGADEEEVVETIAALEREGVLRGYRAVVDWDRVEGERVRAMVELNVTLDRETGYDDIAERLAKFEEVTSLRLVSGDYDFALEVEAPSMGEVSRFVSEQVAPVPEVTQTVTHYVMETYKDRGIELGDGHDDDRLSVTP
jgi:DNA-binding Lrp family transcriptional regulator